MKRLDGKRAIVTGANRGIGRAIAERLAEEGATVMLCARDQALLDQTVDGIVSKGGKAEALSLDLRLADAGSKLVEHTVARWGGVDIVVNNAGATKRGEFVDLTEDDWADGFALKFFGAVRVTRAAWSHLRESHGSVIHISGIGGRTPGAQFAIGGSVNAALLSFTKALAETGLRDGVQVNCISPGTIRTERYSKRLETMAREQGIAMNEAEAAFVKAQRVSRIGEPSEVAGMVAYLVTEGRFLHGSIIDIDGGATKTV